MLTNYSLYKKLEEKIDLSIQKIQSENSKNFIRIFCPLVALYTIQIFKQNYIITIPVVLLCLGLIAWTFDIVKNLFNDELLSSSIKINEHMSQKEKKQYEENFSSNFDRLYKNIYLIQSFLSNGSENKNVFLIFAKDELKETYKYLIRFKRLLNHAPEVDKSNYIKLLITFNDIINTIKNDPELKTNLDRDLYTEIINLKLDT